MFVELHKIWLALMYSKSQSIQGVLFCKYLKNTQQFVYTDLFKPGHLHSLPSGVSAGFNKLCQII
jgi:hypothetical protein